VHSTWDPNKNGEAEIFSFCTRFRHLISFLNTFSDDPGTRSDETEHTIADGGIPGISQE